MNDVSELEPVSLYRRNAQNGFWRVSLRRAIHFLSYHFILKRRTTHVTSAAGFRLVVPPTVFPPRLFMTSEFFAAFIDGLDLRGLRVADIGTGSGILALAAARAGAAHVTAVDVNPNAVRAAVTNARANGYGPQVAGVCSDLLSAVSADALFDVIISSPPSFDAEPRDLADRAWHAGPAYRDLRLLFEQARRRINPSGRAFLLLSSHSDLDLFGELIQRAGFRAHQVASRSIFIESFVIYELRADITVRCTQDSDRSSLTSTVRQF